MIIVKVYDAPNIKIQMLLHVMKSMRLIIVKVGNPIFAEKDEISNRDM